MVRARLAALAVAAGLCGCSTLSNHPWFNRPQVPVISGSVGCEAGGFPVNGFPVTGGPALDSAPVVVTPPGAVTVPGNGTLTPQPAVPDLSAPPRLVPQPATPEPYRPSNRPIRD
jgi:hypothetical protein